MTCSECRYLAPGAKIKFLEGSAVPVHGDWCWVEPVPAPRQPGDPACRHLDTGVVREEDKADAI